MTSQEIRSAFLDFFTSKEHHIVPSAPMVIKDDPTLMFTNAGMNQFKDIILGNKERKYARVADSQKCLRVSGKHNDLEEVGHDTYHHTMFEMLGNWSFGDYFKKEAIAWAWEFLTEVMHMDKDRLYVTIFEGAPSEGIGKDTEAEDFWAGHISRDRILEGNKHDNFWEMGDMGPCGPCSEIHIDLRSDEERNKISGRDLVNKDHPEVVEIWNLVFMQYDRKADGHLEPLPHKVIDTGMGFERLCMAVQKKRSNYETDVFTPIIKGLETITGVMYGKTPETDVALRVVADHIRTIAFAITDGQLPSNAKAGYVIRRILRRAVRYGYTFLGQKEAFMYALLPSLIESMGKAYPELEAQKTLVQNVIREEEESFLRTLEQGIRLLEKKVSELQGEKILSGQIAFELYDTYGFPLDLTELILKEQGLSIDQKEFDALMQQQKDRARNAAGVETEDWQIVSKSEESLFVGYDQSSVETKILKYRKVSQKNKSYFQVVLSQTPFYAEMGGQVGDGGWLESPSGEKFAVEDTKQENNLSVHILKKLPSPIDAVFKASIDTDRRMATEANHTATHLAHYALRRVLGNHVEQKGSYVSPQSLRFDFSHFKKLSPEEIREVEAIVNRSIRQDVIREEFRNIPIAQAKEMGAMALFGEKYGEEVRVLKYGDSVELCGGTHVASTGKIGFFKIISETSIAAGIRRIEAITGEAVERYIEEKDLQMAEISTLLNNPPSIIKALEKLQSDYSILKKQIEEHAQKEAQILKEQVKGSARIVNGVRVMTFQREIDPEIAKNVIGMIRDSMNEPFALISGTSFEGKANLTIVLSKDLAEKGLNASLWIKETATLIQGGGGGQAHFASAGGKNTSGLPDAIETILKKAGWN